MDFFITSGKGFYHFWMVSVVVSFIFWTIALIISSFSTNNYPKNPRLDGVIKIYNI